MKGGLLFFLSMIFLGCMQTEYGRLERRELSKGIRSDSLLLGLHFGMTSKDFYARCWDLNKKGILKEGPSNASVEYKMHDTRYPATLFFYPKFQDDRIMELNCVVSYSDWAPWNPTHHCDTLRNDVEAKLRTWYKTDFITVKSKVRGTAKVAVVANKRITLFCVDDSKLRIIFRDLTVAEPQSK
jgi:hypothetical protein